MTKFETINRTLCRMVEPEPLTPESKFPCVVRLIQDDSPMGRMNRHYKPDTELEKYAIVSKLSDSKLSIIGDKWNGYDIFNHEIIGYPVEEGSHWWALYQMMQGEKVFRVEWECDMYCQYTNNEIITFRYGISSTINPVEEWIANAKRADFGWQLYKEPETDKIASLEAEIAQLKKDKLEFNAQCFHKDETISVLKNRITELEEIIDRIYDISMKKDHEFGLTYQYANDIIKQKAEIDMLKQENAKLRAEIAQLKAQEEK